MNLFAWIRKKTIDTIVADITKMIAHLHVVADAHALEAEAHVEEIKLKQELLAVASKEYARAKNIAAKFQALLS